MVELFPLILIRSGGLPFQTWQSLLSGQIPSPDEERVEQDAALKTRLAFDSLLAQTPGSAFRTQLYNARKSFYKKQKWPSPALLSALESRRAESAVCELLDKLFYWKQTSEWKGRFEKRYTGRIESEWEAIRHFAEDENFRRSLLFASHDLLAQLPGFCSKQPAAFDKKDRRTALSVLQYMARSIFKTSPLGRFTCVQLWRPGSPREIAVESAKISISPNVALLPALYEALLREPVFYSSLEIQLNPCVGAVPEKNRELTWLYFDGEREAFQRMAPNAVVQHIVALLLENGRKYPFRSLISQLRKDVDAGEEALVALIRELIAFGLLEWDLPEKGLTPSWCGNLSQYLAFLAPAPLLTDTAFLLQLLKGSARIIPFQSVEEARQTQSDARAALENFFRSNGATMPPVPVEQVFFEDVERPVDVHCPGGMMEQFAAQLSACWTESDFHFLPPFRSRLQHFAESRLKTGEVLDFQTFCAQFFESEAQSDPVKIRPYRGKTGAMIQVYREGDRYRAVVNAMFPGGGKLYARWLHLFRADFRESVETWNDPDTVLFPWQGWSNANFQAIRTRQALRMPDGRVEGSASQKLLFLSDLGIRKSNEGPELIEKSSGKRVQMTDLGLEDPESRPPVLQVLWHLGVPFVSSLALLQGKERWMEISPGVKRRERINYESLVLAREAWLIAGEFFEALFSPAITEAERYRRCVRMLEESGIPRYFFARGSGKREKPRFFDRSSALSMLLFEKLLREMRTEGVYIEEMLPTPDNWVLGAEEQFAGEFVLEMSIR